MCAWFKRKQDVPGVPIRPSVRIGDLLKEDAILIAEPGLNKTGLLEALVHRSCESHKLGEPAVFLAKVLEREQGISTTIDTGLSLPHARIDGLSRVVAALGVAPGGLSDIKHPNLPIRLMFLFFSPNRQEFFSVHLQLLRAASVFFEPALIGQLSSSATPAAVLALIRAKDA